MGSWGSTQSETEFARGLSVLEEIPEGSESRILVPTSFLNVLSPNTGTQQAARCPGPAFSMASPRPSVVVSEHEPQGRGQLTGTVLLPDFGWCQL